MVWHMIREMHPFHGQLDDFKTKGERRNLPRLKNLWVLFFLLLWTVNNMGVNIQLL